MNLKEIKELIEMVQGTGISEIELEREGFRVRIILGEAHRVHSVKEPAPSKSSPRTGEEDAEKPPASAETSVPEMVPGQIVVKSPMVGTFYRCPAPDSPPFVEVGSAVEKGQPLCIIEAMKLMNEIQADHDGEVVKILVENGQGVEFGQRLFALKPH